MNSMKKHENYSYYILNHAKLLNQVSILVPFFIYFNIFSSISINQSPILKNHQKTHLAKKVDFIVQKCYDFANEKSNI